MTNTFTFTKDQSFAHMKDGMMITSIIKAGTIAQIIEVGDSYQTPDGDTMTRVVLSIHDHFLPLVHYIKNLKELSEEVKMSSVETRNLFGQLEKDALEREINRALDTGNKELFYELTKGGM